MTNNVRRLHENSQELRFASESIIFVLFERSEVLVLLHLLIVFFVYLYVSIAGCTHLNACILLAGVLILTRDARTMLHGTKRTFSFME